MYGHICMCSNLVTCMYPVISVLVNQWHNMHMCNVKQVTRKINSYKDYSCCCNENNTLLVLYFVIC